MLATGLTRDGLTRAETVAAIQTLFDLGQSQTSIARATGLKAAEVKAARKVAAALTTLPEGAEELNLLELADLADFADDQAATDDLLEAAGDQGEFAHKVAQLRRRRAADGGRRQC